MRTVSIILLLLLIEHFEVAEPLGIIQFGIVVFSMIAVAQDCLEIIHRLKS